MSGLTLARLTLASRTIGDAERRRTASDSS